jgi:hypothetical protein
MKLPVFARKPWFISLAAIALLILVMPLLARAYYFITAPKFSAIEYVRTEANNGCLALITDDACMTADFYRAHGRELDIATKLISDMEKKKYSLKNGEEALNIVCGLAAGNNSDLYVFSKNNHASSLEEIYISFSSSNLPNDYVGDGESKLGCGNVDAEYEVKIIRN